MKKIIFLMLLVIGFTINSKAQRATTMTLAVGDTTIDAGTASKVLPIATQGYAGVAIEVLLTKISGTVGGTLVVQGSNDGTNYTAIGSAYTQTNTASQSTMFYVSEPVPVYIRTLSTGTGTMKVVQTVKYVFRKHD